MLKRLAGCLVASSLFSRASAALVAYGVPLPVRLAAYAVMTLVPLVLSMWIWQESLLYMPSVPNPQDPLFGNALRTPAEGPAGYRSPSERGLAFEDVRLVASDGVKCHAWFLPAANKSSAFTLLFSHENAGSMALRLPQLELLHKNLGCNILAYDYRGYGLSDSVVIDEEGLMRDAHAAWRWLTQTAEVDTSRIVLYGASLGGAVTIQLARDLCDAALPAAPLPLGVVVCNTFTDIEGMLTAKYAWLDWPIVRRHMLRLRWKSIEHVAHVALPLLLIVGAKDELVPPAHTRLLERAAVASPKVSTREVADGMHNDTWLKAGDSYVAWLKEFVVEAEAARDQKVG